MKKTIRSFALFFAVFLLCFAGCAGTGRTPAAEIPVETYDYTDHDTAGYNITSSNITPVNVHFEISWEIASMLENGNPENMVFIFFRIPENLALGDDPLAVIGPVWSTVTDNFFPTLQPGGEEIRIFSWNDYKGEAVAGPYKGEKIGLLRHGWSDPRGGVVIGETPDGVIPYKAHVWVLE